MMHQNATPICNQQIISHISSTCFVLFKRQLFSLSSRNYVLNSSLPSLPGGRASTAVARMYRQDDYATRLVEISEFFTICISVLSLFFSTCRLLSPFLTLSNTTICTPSQLSQPACTIKPVCGPLYSLIEGPTVRLRRTSKVLQDSVFTYKRKLTLESLLRGLWFELAHSTASPDSSDTSHVSEPQALANT